MEQFKYCPFCRNTLERKDIEGRKRQICPECGWINYVNPVPAVSCVVRDKNNNILLVKRAVEPQKGKWSLPAGFIEIDESTEGAAKRELKEETGLDGKDFKLIGVYIQSSRKYGKVLTVGYSVGQVNGELRAGGDVDGVKFKRIEDLSGIPFKSHRNMLRDFGKSSKNEI